MTETTFSAAPGISSHATIDTLQTRFALRVAARLTERADELGPDISERLRFAREKALERALAGRTAEGTVAVGSGRYGTMLLGRAAGTWWRKLALVLPALALAGGLVMIQRTQDSSQINAAAEVDEALLSDELPPSAYSDAGFAEFLKTPAQ